MGLHLLLLPGERRVGAQDSLGSLDCVGVEIMPLLRGEATLLS